MRATFKADTPPPGRDTRAVFQEVMVKKTFPVIEQVVSTAQANTKHKGVAGAYSYGTAVNGNKVTAWAANSHPLFNIVEGGSKPHVIRPKNATILRFPIGGRIVWAREVHHPGTKGGFALKRAFATHKGTTEEAIREGTREYLLESLGTK